MTRSHQIKFNIKPLSELRADLSSGMVSKVGVIGAKATRANSQGGFNNAEIGIVHEMGSEFLGIPARSFLRMPLETKKREIMAFVKKNGGLIESGEIKKFFTRLGIFAEGIIQEAFATGGFGKWAKNAESTIAAKGSSAPLIDTGELRKSITSEVAKNA